MFRMLHIEPVSSIPERGASGCELLFRNTVLSSVPVRTWLIFRMDSSDTGMSAWRMNSLSASLLRRIWLGNKPMRTWLISGNWAKINRRRFWCMKSNSESSMKSCLSLALLVRLAEPSKSPAVLLFPLHRMTLLRLPMLYRKEPSTNLGFWRRKAVLHLNAWLLVIWIWCAQMVLLKIRYLTSIQHRTETAICCQMIATAGFPVDSRGEIPLALSQNMLAAGGHLLSLIRLHRISMWTGSHRAVARWWLKKAISVQSADIFWKRLSNFM